MIPMFPFSINNTLKLFATNNQESIDEQAIKERISEAVIQSLPNKRNIKFNAIIVLECDNDQKRTIIMNETVANNNSNINGQKMQFTATFPGNTFTTISTSESSNTSPTNVLLSQQPIFPATMEGLQALLNLTSSSMNRSNSSDSIVHSNFSFIPIQTEQVESVIKMEKRTDNTDGGFTSRKRKSEKPRRIPQEGMSDTNGLDLTLGTRFGGYVKQEKCQPQSNNVAIWPHPVSIEGRSVNTFQPMILPRVKKAPQLPGQKKTSKVFNCNQCKLQFNSLNALCKHTFSDHRAFRCTFCSANFTQRSNLQRHSLKHVGFKPFICNVCNKAYYRKDHLVRHIEVSHPGSDPKSNITVKLSSSECLEYLEKMQSNRLMELSMVDDVVTSLGDNNFLPAVTVVTSDTHNLFMASEDGDAVENRSPVISDQIDIGTVDPDDDTGSGSPERLQISMDTELSVKKETFCEHVPPLPQL